MTAPTPPEVAALVDRLRGRYPIGPIGQDGTPEFGYRDFPIDSPLREEAAAALEALARQRDAEKDRANRMWKEAAVYYEDDKKLRAERDALRAQWQEFAGYEVGEHVKRAKCISDALGIEDQSTTKQCAAIESLRARIAAIESEARQSALDKDKFKKAWNEVSEKYEDLLTQLGGPA